MYTGGNPFDIPRGDAPPPGLLGEIALLHHWCAMSGVDRKNALISWMLDRCPSERQRFLEQAQATLDRQEAA